MVNGEKKVYKAGKTVAEYTPWLRHHIKAHHIVYGDPLSTYINDADVRKAMNIPDSLPAFQLCSDKVYDNYVALA